MPQNDATWTELYNQFKQATNEIKIRGNYEEVKSSGTLSLSYLCWIPGSKQELSCRLSLKELNGI